VHALLAVLLAVLASLPVPPAGNDGGQSAPHLAAATNQGSSATGLRLELHLLSKSTQAWPGSAAPTSVGSATTASGPPAPPAITTDATRPHHSIDPHVLVVRGRAPPHTGAAIDTI
jgi:hypothetical protein